MSINYSFFNFFSVTQIYKNKTCAYSHYNKLVNGNNSSPDAS